MSLLTIFSHKVIQASFEDEFQIILGEAPTSIESVNGFYDKNILKNASAIGFTSILESIEGLECWLLENIPSDLKVLLDFDLTNIDYPTNDVWSALSQIHSDIFTCPNTAGYFFSTAEGTPRFNEPNELFNGRDPIDHIQKTNRLASLQNQDVRLWSYTGFHSEGLYLISYASSLDAIGIWWDQSSIDENLLILQKAKSKIARHQSLWINVRWDHSLYEQSIDHLKYQFSLMLSHGIKGFVFWIFPKSFSNSNHLKTIQLINAYLQEIFLETQRFQQQYTEVLSITNQYSFGWLDPRVKNQYSHIPFSLYSERSLVANHYSNKKENSHEYCIYLCPLETNNWIWLNTSSKCTLKILDTIRMSSNQANAWKTISYNEQIAIKNPLLINISCH